MMLIPDLHYRDDEPAMRREPSNIELAQAAAWFNKGKPVFVTLEPGDATRYDLLLVLHGESARIPTWGDQTIATIVRYRGGHAIEADNFRWPYEGRWVLDNIGKTNEWSRTFLDWWLQVFAEATASAKNALSPTKIGDDIIMPMKLPTGSLGESLCTRNLHVVDPRPWSKGMTCQCSAYTFYRHWMRTMMNGSQAENDHRYHAIMNSERPIELQVERDVEPNRVPLRVVICQPCVDAGFPDHGSDVPAEMGLRPCARSDT